MKPIILFLALIFSLNASAGWMSDSHIILKKSGGPGAASYRTKDLCENAESETCFEHTGKNLNYFTNQAGVLAEDPTLKTAYETAEAVKAADQATRNTKKAERITSMAACVTAVNGVPALTPDDIKDCLNILIKELYDKDIAVTDL